MDVEKKRQREQETVAKIIEIYCHDHHGKRSGLCPECEELAHYAEARITACPRMLLHHPLMTLHHMMLSWQMRLERFAFFRRSRQSDRSVKVK